MVREHRAGGVRARAAAGSRWEEGFRVQEEGEGGV